MKQRIQIALSLISEPYKGWAAMAIAGSLVIAALDTLGVAAMLPLMQLLTGVDPDSGVLGVFSRTLGTDDTGTLVLAVAGVVGGAFIVKTIVSVAFRWWLVGRTTKLGTQAATELFNRYVSAPYWAHRQRRVSEIHRALATAVSQTYSQVLLGYLSIVPDLLTIVAIALVLTFVSPLATVIAVVFFLIITLGLQWRLKTVHRSIGEELAESDLQAWNALMPGVNGFKESRLSGTTGSFVTKFGTAKIRTARASRKLSLVSELPKYILEIGLIVGIALIAAVMFATSSPEYALSTLGVFAAAGTRMLPTLNRVMATAAGIRAGSVGLQILTDEITVLDRDGYHDSGTVSGEPYEGDISFDRVTYRFPDSDTPVLSDVSTTIPSGSTVAFVGGSGAGKSTLLDVLLGLLEPTSGRVTSGGREIFEDISRWHSQIGVVPQEVFVLDDTVRANIAYGLDESEIDPERLGEAVERAQLTSIIGQLPEGLDTRLGERGVRLSGGQRQRIGIARALYRRPQVLALDEATSALDNMTERKITETIESLSGDMTIVIVAHRLSTVKNADRVVFMADGRIETEGTFAQVEQNNSNFAQLVALGRLS